MANSKSLSYGRSSRHPFYGLISVLPVLFFYELIALTLNQDKAVGIRNAADVILKNIVFNQLVAWFGIHKLFAYGLVIVAALGIVLYKKAKTANLDMHASYFFYMFLESLFYAFLLGPLVGHVTNFLQYHLISLSITPFQLDLPYQIMLSLGAGIYEELFFRVILLSGLALIFTRGAKIGRNSAFILAALISSIAFSGFHYIGPLADTLTFHSFVFRFLAGLVFSALYIVRGFGIAVYTHTFYDLLLVLSIG